MQKQFLGSKNFIVGSFLLFSFVALSTSVAAQIATITQKPRSGINITLSPVFMNLAVQAGTSKKYSFKVTNNNEFVETYNLSVIKYQPDEKGSIIPSDIKSTPDPTLSWFRFPNRTISVPSKSTLNVDFEIAPEKDAFLGYYFGIAVERSREEFSSTDTAKLVGAPTIPILLEVTRLVDGKLVGVDADISKYKSGVIASFKTSSSWYEELPTEFEITFKNDGKIHLVPFGEIFVSQGANSEIATIPINEGGGNTLPNSQRVYKSSWNDDFIVREPVKENGEYKKNEKGEMIYKAQIYWDKLSKFRIGRYTAHAVLVYNNGQIDVPVESEVSFWIIPWKILLVAAVILSLVIFGLRNLVVGLIRS